MANLCLHDYLSNLGGALAGIIFFLYGLAPNPVAGENCLHFRSFLKIPRIVGKSLPHRVGVFSMLPNPSKCQLVRGAGTFSLVAMLSGSHA